MDRWIDSFGQEFVRLLPGEFLMGSPPDELGRDADEAQHAVVISRSRWIATTPVTQVQWMRLMGGNPSRFLGDNLPVDSVSWHDAGEFCHRLSGLDGDVYRLPTEAEWEYACRCGSTAAFAFGKDLTPAAANIGPEGSAAKAIDRRTSVVRRYPANLWGIFDMHGNVWEWCADFYGEYPAEVTRDPFGPTRGTYRVVRGGSWGLGPAWARSASRYAAPPDRPIDIGASGFRLVVERPD